MRKVIEAVSPDMKVGEYSIKSDIIFRPVKRRDRVLFRSINGNGTLLIQRTENGSQVTITSDEGNPASGYAKTLRNYLSAMCLLSDDSKVNKGIVYSNMSADEMARFLSTSGSFIGFKEVP